MKKIFILLVSLLFSTQVYSQTLQFPPRGEYLNFYHKSSVPSIGANGWGFWYDPATGLMKFRNDPNVAGPPVFSSTWQAIGTVAGGGTGLTSGTSGGIPYFSSTTTMASSALLTNHGLMVGGGAGATPATIAVGLTGQVLQGSTGANPIWTYTPTLGANGLAVGTLSFAGSTSGLATFTAQANAGTPTISIPTGSGTILVSASSPLAVNSVTGNISITGAAGQVLAGATPAFTATPTLGVNGLSAGAITFAGSTSGSTIFQQQAVAGAANQINIPTNAGTFVVSATSPLSLNGITGDLSCPTCATTSSQITLNSGASFGITAPGAMTIGGTYSIGTTSDNLQFNSLGLGVAAPGNGRINQTLGANGVNAHIITRNTDTTPTGSFLLFRNAASGTLFKVDITGAITDSASINTTGNMVAGGLVSAGANLQLQSGGTIYSAAGALIFQAQTTLTFQSNGPSTGATLDNTQFVVTRTTDATTTSDGALSTSGGLSVAKKGVFGDTVTGTDFTGTGTLRANTGFSANGTAGQSVTITVRDSAGTGTCTIIFTFGLKTGGTCA